jgi:hypothetical protein
MFTMSASGPNPDSTFEIPAGYSKKSSPFKW